MKNIEFKNIDPEDVEDLLLKVEKSFNIKFVEHELAHIKTFGEMCDYIKDKIQLENTDNCTLQQAFYKLRRVLVTVLGIDKDSITINTTLAELLPRKERKKRIKQIERELGFELLVIRPPHFVSGFFILLLLGSLTGLFFRADFALVGLVFAISGLWLANKTGKELTVKTVGQLVQKITRENYLKSRRNPNTYNKDEIEKILIEWFSNELVIGKSKLTRQTKLT